MSVGEGGGGSPQSPRILFSCSCFSQFCGPAAWNRLCSVQPSVV